MTLALSTSSPVASVAVFADDGRLLGSAAQEAQWAASSALATLTEQLLSVKGVALSEVTACVVDVGPGGFTGTRAGVAFAKALAWAGQKSLAAVSAFDLIDTDGDAFVPSKKGHWFVRTPGAPPAEMALDTIPEGTGYGPGATAPVYPRAARAWEAKEHWILSDPFLLVPSYLAEPSISVPNKPFTVLREGGQ